MPGKYLAISSVAMFWRRKATSDCDCNFLVHSGGWMFLPHFGGGSWVRPRPRRPPPETVLGNCVVSGLYSGHFRLCVWYCVCFSVLVCFFGKLCCGHVGFKGPAKSRTHEPSWGLSDVSGKLFGYCATGGGYHGGGVFGPLGTMVPRGDSPREGRAAHGPLHPAV